MIRKILIFNLIFFLLISTSFSEIICPNCKKQNPDEAKFCAYCGSSLTIEEKIEKIETEKVKPKPPLTTTLEGKEKILKLNILKGLIFLATGIILSSYGLSMYDATKIKTPKIETTFNEETINGYYYNSIDLNVKNESNTTVKNILIKLNCYDNNENLIKTTYVTLDTLHKEKKITLNLDTEQSEINYIEANVVNFEYEKVYKRKANEAIYLGVVFLAAGVYNLYKYYNYSVRYEKELAKKTNFEFYVKNSEIFLKYKFLF